MAFSTLNVEIVCDLLIVIFRPNLGMVLGEVLLLRFIGSNEDT
jgi:hypothetical protein